MSVDWKTIEPRPEGAIAPEVKDIQKPKRKLTKLAYNRGDVLTGTAHAAVLAFCLDGGVLFLPLMLHNNWLNSVTVCLSPDFVLCIMTSQLEFSRWPLREQKTTLNVIT
ncbi:acyl-CoA thioesterase II [Apiospora aurea]|uniref:Acyl-CoA thioesterase II n=1 Tax=Apiospora aurea TaxID=335848 RepID=A0ABR1PSV4_9PEZI